MIKSRVIEAHRTNYTVMADRGEFTATVRGAFHAEGDFPKVGDYVLISYLDDEKAVIETVLERNSIIKRKAADSDDEQIIATNVDVIFIVMGLDADYNISRLERYLLLAEQSGIKAVVVLNKTDTINNVHEKLEEVAKVANKSPLIAVSALTGDGMESILKYLPSGSTSVLLGSSGAGKSTITNWLLNESKQAVQDTREADGRGRHTTTSRYLFTLPNGSFLIDTPGMRELGVLESDVDNEQIVFDKIENYAVMCKFNNCDHEKSAGCAVLEAIENGDISAREINNYQKLLRERNFQESKKSKQVEFQEQHEKRITQRSAAAERQRMGKRFKE